MEMKNSVIFFFSAISSFFGDSDGVSQAPADDEAQLLRRERLREEVVGAVLHRATAYSMVRTP